MQCTPIWRELRNRFKLLAFVISWLWAGGKTDNAAIGNQRRRKHKKENCKWDAARRKKKLEKRWKSKWGMEDFQFFNISMWNVNDANICFFIRIKEKCVESFPPHLQFSLQSETDFPEIPSEFRISWNCLSLSDHTTLMWRSCIHPEISDVSDFSWIKCLWNLVLKYGPFPTVNENYEVWAFQFSELSSDCIPQTT